MFWPCETRTSTCRSFATISSGLYCFLAITILLDVKDIPQVGPLQWGRITLTPKRGASTGTDMTRSGSVGPRKQMETGGFSFVTVAIDFSAVFRPFCPTGFRSWTNPVNGRSWDDPYAVPKK